MPLPPSLTSMHAFREIWDSIICKSLYLLPSLSIHPSSGTAWIATLRTTLLRNVILLLPFPGIFLGLRWDRRYVSLSVSLELLHFSSTCCITNYHTNGQGQNRQAWGSAMLFARVSSCSQATFHFHRSCVTPSTAPPWRAKRDLLHRRLVGCACNWPTTCHTDHILRDRKSQE